MRHGDVDIKDSQTFISKSSGETERIAQFIIKKYLENRSDKPLVFILEGNMGVGKTIFVKGAGRLFDVENITSPTYVISCEYKIKSGDLNSSYTVIYLISKSLTNLNILDLRNISNPEIFYSWNGEKRRENFMMY